MTSLPETITSARVGAAHRGDHETLHTAYNRDRSQAAHRALPSWLTTGYMKWGSVVVPDTTFGYAGVPGSVTMSTIRDVGTIRRTLVYKSFLEVASFAGAVGTNPELDSLSDATASVFRHEFWNNTFGTSLYMKSGGTPIVDGFGARILDLSHKDAQRYSIVGARAAAGRIGADAQDTALFADTVNDTLIGTGGIASNPDGVSSNNDWEDRFVKPFAASVFSALCAQGVPIVVNGSGSKSGYHSEQSVDAGDSRLRWMYTLHRYVFGFAHEYAFQGSDDDPLDDSIAVTGVAANGYKSWWRRNLRIPALAFRLNRAYYGIVSGTGQALRFARGSMLLMWDGINEACIFDFNGGALTDTSPSWRFETGYPIAARQKVSTDSYTWKRQFQLGTLVVNPHFGTAHTVNSVSVSERDIHWFPGEWF